MAEEAKRENIKTPIGEVRFIHLEEPDVRFDAEGNYNITLAIAKSDDEAKEFKKIVDQAVADIDGKRSPVEDDPDDDSAWLVKAKSKYKPLVFDSAKNVIEDRINAGPGTSARLGVVINPYAITKSNKGVNLYFNAIQIINLVKFAGSGLAANPFDEEDGGFVAGADDTTDSGVEDIF